MRSGSSSSSTTLKRVGSGGGSTSNLLSLSVPSSSASPSPQRSSKRDAILKRHFASSSFSPSLEQQQQQQQRDGGDNDVERPQVVPSHKRSTGSSSSTTSMTQIKQQGPILTPATASPTKVSNVSAGIAAAALEKRRRSLSADSVKRIKPPVQQQLAQHPRSRTLTPPNTSTTAPAVTTTISTGTSTLTPSSHRAKRLAMVRQKKGNRGGGGGHKDEFVQHNQQPTKSKAVDGVYSQLHHDQQQPASPSAASSAVASCADSNSNVNCKIMPTSTNSTRTTSIMSTSSIASSNNYTNNNNNTNSTTKATMLLLKRQSSSPSLLQPAPPSQPASASASATPVSHHNTTTRSFQKRREFILQKLAASTRAKGNKVEEGASAGVTTTTPSPLRRSCSSPELSTATTTPIMQQPLHDAQVYDDDDSVTRWSSSHVNANSFSLGGGINNNNNLSKQLFDLRSTHDAEVTSALKKPSQQALANQQQRRSTSTSPFQKSLTAATRRSYSDALFNYTNAPVVPSSSSSSWVMRQNLQSRSPSPTFFRQTPPPATNNVAVQQEPPTSPSVIRAMTSPIPDATAMAKAASALVAAASASFPSSNGTQNTFNNTYSSSSSNNNNAASYNAYNNYDLNSSQNKAVAAGMAEGFAGNITGTTAAATVEDYDVDGNGYDKDGDRALLLNMDDKDRGGTGRMAQRSRGVWSDNTAALNTSPPPRTATRSTNSQANEMHQQNMKVKEKNNNKKEVRKDSPGPQGSSSLAGAAQRVLPQPTRPVASTTAISIFCNDSESMSSGTYNSSRVNNSENEDRMDGCTVNDPEIDFFFSNQFLQQQQEEHFYTTTTATPITTNVDHAIPTASIAADSTNPISGAATIRGAQKKRDYNVGRNEQIAIFANSQPQQHQRGDIRSVNTGSVSAPAAMNCEGRAEERFKDPSWDAASVYFGKFAEEMKKIKESEPEELNMFDTESWVRTEVSFHTIGLPTVLPSSSTAVMTQQTEVGAGSAVQHKTAVFVPPHHRHSEEEEKKEKDRDIAAGPIDHVKTGGLHYGNVPEQARGRQLFMGAPSCAASVDAPSTLPSLHVYTCDFANDDDDQVESEITHSEAGLTDILGKYDGSGGNKLMMALSSPNKSYASGFRPNWSGSTAMMTPSTLAPIMESFAIQQQNASTCKHTNLEKHQHQAQTYSNDQSGGSQHHSWSPGGQPPPPPPGTPSKKNRIRTPQHLGGKSSPSAARKTGAATPRASESGTANFFWQDFGPQVEAENKTEVNTEARHIFSTPPKRKPHYSGGEPDTAHHPSAHKPCANHNMSPVSSAVIMQDHTKLAERVDLAISVAASKFDEKFTEQTATVAGETKATATLEDINGGAFNTWEVERTSPKHVSAVHRDVDSARDPPVPSELETNTNGLDNSVSLTSIGTSATNTSFATYPSGDRHLTDRKRMHPPQEHPSPFEKALERAPQILSVILSFLGDPVVVCRVKMTSKACFQYVEDNEHKLMRDAVRLGGMSMNVRPSFWLWVTLQKSAHLSLGTGTPRRKEMIHSCRDLEALEREGRMGKWHSVIERDVARAFGNFPPHKTGARLRTDSIVRALVTWGRNRVMKRGLRGTGEPPPASQANSVDSDDVSLTPTDTVSDWGGVTPAGSFTSSVSGGEARNDRSNHRDRQSHQSRSKKACPHDLALGGNALTEDMKASLQNKLSFILHALAAAHIDVGYCQGMDYVVAHLLRILQDTVRWEAANGTLPSVVRSAPTSFYGQDMDSQERLEMYAEIDRSLVVEEACFRVMDSFFSVYNLRHFYWPELRCLKTSCLVFERLIKIKLPVLADHFEHHELNVGLFALGWFQTLFLYLPSMPSATVCHMWDIWIVERSFKIFFRVGTAILFLSQPILLNHELEGMMSYLNTFPDATLLSPDILIACALQIKVTNRLLMELEREVSESF